MRLKTRNIQNRSESFKIVRVEYQDFYFSKIIITLVPGTRIRGIDFPNSNYRFPPFMIVWGYKNYT